MIMYDCSVWILIWTLRPPSAPEPGDDFGPIGGVDDHGVAVGPLVDEDVVADATLLVADQAVAHLAVLERGGVVGVDVLNQGEGVGAAERETAHVADVEQASGSADGLVFVNDSAVLNGHFPAGKWYDARAVLDMPVEKRRAG